MLARALEPGRLVILPHYRAFNYTHFRKVEYGAATTLQAIEAALPAVDRQIGDSYTCLQPVVGGIYEASVVADPVHPGAKIWARVSQVEA